MKVLADAGAIRKLALQAQDSLAIHHSLYRKCLVLHQKENVYLKDLTAHLGKVSALAIIM